jgi:flagellar biosynthesis component FlhA
MINLLSQQSKKSITTQYFWRLGTVAGIIISGFLFMGTVLLIPSYFVVHEKEQTEITRAAELQSDEAFQENKELGMFVETTNNQLEKFGEIRKFSVAERFIEPILGYASLDGGVNIRLDNIRYRIADDEAIINLQGTAETRDDLLGFIETLKSDELFSSVDVPVSSFVQNTDINFQAVLSSSIEDI